MTAPKHLLQFLSVLYDSPKAMGIEEFARTNRSFTARSLYRWQAELSDDLIFYPSVAFRSLGLSTMHLFIDDPSPIWREFPYAIRGEWVVSRPGQHTLYLHCLVPSVHELQLVAVLRDAEGVTAAKITSIEARDGWQVLRDFGTSPVSRTPTIARDQHVWDIVERLPLLIAVIFECVEQGQSLPAIWESIYARLGKRTWDYLPRFARRLPTNGKAYVKECFALLNHTGLFRQNIIRYRPLNAVGTPMFLRVEGSELSAIINAFAEHSPSVDVFPIGDDVALLRVVSTHELTQHVFSTAANLPRINDWHFVDALRNEREPVRPRFAYELLFDPATTEWVFPTEMLQKFRGGTP
jgi:hypothetical protein